MDVVAVQLDAEDGEEDKVSTLFQQSGRSRRLAVSQALLNNEVISVLSTAAQRGGSAECSPAEMSGTFA